MTTLKSFDVLSRNLNVRQSHFLEASAGTGKTYSIENIVVRLLVDGSDPLTIDQILVVTFTREATRELKQRIRSCIAKTLDWLVDEMSENLKKSLPDYLQAIHEQGAQNIQKSRRALEDALFCFDQAQIFTIHGFCSRMLRENGFECDIGFELSSEVDPIAKSKVISTVRDFFRTEVREEVYSPEQLKKLLKKYPVDKLETALFKELTSGMELLATPNFSTDFESFRQAIQSLKEIGYISSQAIVDDFNLQAPAYNKIFRKDKTMQPLIEQAVKRFADLFEKPTLEFADFDRLIADGVIYCSALDVSQLKKKADPIPLDRLHYPRLMDDLQKLLVPLVERASDPLAIFVRMAHYCRRLFKRVTTEEESPVPDDFLHLMRKGIQESGFADRVRQTYGAAIIDEFQDTDSIQWDIFRDLFAKGSCALYMVGDPKQSIYGFRRADIYTYLEASRAIDKGNHASLDTNYRSKPALVEALNALFSDAHAPGLITLPRFGQHLTYRQVKADLQKENVSFADGKGSVHFFIANGKRIKSSDNWPTSAMEQDGYFPFIAHEIQRLNKLNNLRYQQMAILVRDRYQADRIACFLKTLDIPSVLQREGSLADSLASGAVRECLEAALHPKDHSALKTALGGRLIGWTQEQILALDQQVLMEQVLAKWQQLRRQLFKFGAATFFRDLMHSSWHPHGQSVMETLLGRTDGEELYRDFQQIASILVEHQSATHCPPSGLLTFLDTFPQLAEDNDDRLKIRQDPNRDAVQILTMHVSKGLEFDIVFALGLVKRTSGRDELIPIKHQGEMKRAAPTTEHQEAAQQHQMESDAEKIRLLYVAMTRAKLRLYVPVAIEDGVSVVTPGTASCMDLFLARFNQAAANSDDELYDRIGAQDGQALKAFIDNTSQEIKISYSVLSDPIESTKSSKPSVPELITPRMVPKIPGSASYITSFTAMAANSSHEAVPHGTAPHNYAAAIKDAHTLPAGSDTGTLFHQIFEGIDFQSFQDMKDSNECLPMIRKLLEKHPLQEWEESIARIVFNTLTKPLINGWRLCDIQLGNAFREMEFLYPYRGENISLPEEIRLENHFLKGTIDLFFMHEGKYYIVDWKSNWLGTKTVDYHHDQLKSAMLTHQYSLQATIYTEAARRYLKLFEKIPFKACFGGVFYLFFRGIDPQDPHNHGVYEWREACTD